MTRRPARDAYLAQTVRSHYCIAVGRVRMPTDRSGSFNYADYFPDSERVKRFDRRGRTVWVGRLLETQLEVYRAQVKSKTMSPSTHAGDEKAINGERMQFWAEVPLAEATPSKLRDWIGSFGSPPGPCGTC